MSKQGLRIAGALGLMLVLVHVGWLLGGWGGPTLVGAMDDVVQLSYAAAAAACCARAATRASSTRRGLSAAAGPGAARPARQPTGRTLSTQRAEQLAWVALGTGLGAWAAGQAVWTWYQVVRGVETPFPSLADLGYLIFPLGGVAALLLFARAAGTSSVSRTRLLLDGMLVAGSLFAVSWASALGAVFHAGSGGAFSTAVSLAYPASDLVLVTMAVLALSSGARSRTPRLLVGGLALMGVADSAFAYLTATDQYGSSNVMDAGWSAAYVLFGLAALAWRPDRDTPTTVTAAASASMPGSAPLWPPYLPLGLACALASYHAYHRLGSDPLIIATGLLVVTLLVRQLLALAENRRLVRDIAAREQQLHHQAFHDPLTGLANRALFTDRLEHAVELQRRDHRSLALLYLDLDDFKIVNDTMGHPAGDALLVGVAERLRGALRTTDTVARLGGDEFAVLIEEGAEKAMDLGRHVVEAFTATFSVDGHALAVRASVGLVRAPAEDAFCSADDLLRRGDLAMYVAKRSDDPLAVFDARMHDSDGDERQLRHDLAAAVAAGHITTAYQPLVDTVTGQLAGVEALARWTHAERGSIAPERFIAIAEQTGLMRELGTRMLRTALADLAHWRTLGAERLRVAVNVSAQQLVDPDLPDQVSLLLARYAIPADRLILEITEGALISGVEPAVLVARRLDALGVNLALDDFGTGYSSLAHLARFPLRELKIDRSFVEPLGREPQHRVFFAALLQLAASLGLTTIAEGVERPEQLEILADLGCDLVQGFLTGRPTDAAAISELVVTAARDGGDLPAPRVPTPEPAPLSR